MHEDLSDFGDTPEGHWLRDAFRRDRHRAPQPTHLSPATASQLFPFPLGYTGEFSHDIELLEQQIRRHNNWALN